MPRRGRHKPLHLDKGSFRALIGLVIFLVCVAILRARPAVRWALLGLVAGGVIFAAVLILSRRE